MLLLNELMVSYNQLSQLVTHKLPTVTTS